MQPECIFCQIIAGKVPSKMIHQNDLAMAIMALEQEVPGHIIVFPKQHFASLEVADDQSLLAIMTLITELGTQSLAAGFDSYNLLCADGKPAGQSVPHVHFHFIPRKTGDGLNAWPTFGYHGDVDGDALFRKLRF
ncbi:HIT family protein [Levilactobacillus enshiensis]|uniref:HIT family protein n=1 Tax=Levilactobacillus enshiensis TaxID=2590213 RepID=UPI00117B25CE|nr:HIT family protein [Levilactobacillus enshiensis]